MLDAAIRHDPEGGVVHMRGQIQEVRHHTSPKARVTFGLMDVDGSLLWITAFGSYVKHPLIAVNSCVELQSVRVSRKYMNATLQDTSELSAWSSAPALTARMKQVIWH